jgi:GntR family transcriptional regulator
MKLDKSDLRGGTPIYLQVAERIKHSIATGELVPGQQLPTVRQLAHDLRVNFNTIARAYAVLDTAGIITTQQGQGTYVRERPNSHAHSQLRADKLRTLVGTSVLEAFSLGYKPDEIREVLDETLRRFEQSGK